jgi:hypothetical protein
LPVVLAGPTHAWAQGGKGQAQGAAPPRVARVSPAPTPAPKGAAAALPPPVDETHPPQPEPGAASGTTSGTGGGGPPGSTPAERYAKLERFECQAELTRRKVPFRVVAEARGVLAPVRLTGPVNGVSFHGNGAEATRAQSPYEIMDCRLVLALSDFALQLATRGITEVVHMSAYRPPPAKGWAAGQLGHRHEGALAIDIGSFKKADGTQFVVESDFRSFIGGKSCGAGASPIAAWPAAQELRGIVCDADSAKLFNLELTPHYNWPHRNHFHFEVTPGVSWFIVH